MNFLINDAVAQTAGAAAQPNMFASFAPLVIVFVIFYFLMIRPQQKKVQQERKFIEALKKGDEIYTKSGMLGIIYGMTDKIVKLELEGGIKVKFLKAQIGGPTKELLETPKVTK